ncbi:DNA polymerase III subunit gamma/tau [Planktothrix sp. FACHB-1355]|uniref:DNA polymerase III subunit gamma/tau n=1 Tax=Aerosakkonema funiforme FACHB-1375 TaxID=2949571 RepID=A0A926VKN1_9CYAN|nr:MULTISPECIES: DNA polymerase III subunit gamma/tau [Oscillatoriales]MBD2184512.1 DNA polymerase III subunit gamma/tau [Aerosakkonema funiforme FACHB-1375]MBD3558031.1 DNA polymerase III subunit gamma/tau [Planktothrix sp. FACHB-1355]
MTYEPLHHKYRPSSFADLVGQDAIATTLTNAIQQKRIAPAYLFTGPRGTGKTSSARILAKSLNCLSHKDPTPQPCGKCDVCQGIAKGSTLDVIEIDAASNTGVDNIRELIEKAQFAPVQCRHKVYIIDECHMLSAAAFNALLKTLEEPPDRVVFVLATTDPQRVLPTIISRCQRFDFRRIPLEAMVKHLRHIANKENIDITDDAIVLVGQIAQGGLRDAESTLDQLSLLSGEVTVEKVWDLVGAVPEKDLMSLLDAIATNDSTSVIDITRRLMDRGREPLIVLQNLASFYRDLLIAKTAPNRSDLVAVTAPTWQALCDFQGLEINQILFGQKQLKDSEVQIKNTTQPRLWLEVTLLALLPSAIASTISPISVQQTAKPLNNPAIAPKVNSTPSSNQVTKKVERSEIISPSIPVPTENPQFHKQEVIPVVEQVPDAPIEAEPSHANFQQDDVSLIAENSFNLEDIWQQVIKNTRLPGAKRMLRDHCYLVYVKGREAMIGIKTESLTVTIKGTLPQIEEAFSKTFNDKIKINFQSNHTTENKFSRRNQQQGSIKQQTQFNQTNTSALSNPNLASSPTFTEPPSNYSPIKTDDRPSIQPQENTDGPKPNFASETKPDSNTVRLTSPPTLPLQGEESKVSPSSAQGTGVGSSYPNKIKPDSSIKLPPDLPKSSQQISNKNVENIEIDNDSKVVLDAAQRLANFFEGEIIQITDDLEQILFPNKPEISRLNITDVTASEYLDTEEIAENGEEF